MNLLEETIDDIERSGHTPDDILFIGSLESGHGCTWDEFRHLANFEYDCGFGSQKIAKDLTIVFSDNSTMWRHEYDGSECWEYSLPPVVPEKTTPIKSLGGDRHMWKTLEEINEEDEEE